jgi:hypothetical protein
LEKKSQISRTIDISFELNDSTITREFLLTAKYWRKRWAYAHQDKELLPMNSENDARINQILQLQEQLSEMEESDPERATQLRKELAVARWDITEVNTIGAYAIEPHNYHEWEAARGGSQ